MAVERRFDPDRRNRIIDAALDVIAQEGVPGASHRRIAKQANVPLGSMTYHFENIDQLMQEAFKRFAESIAMTFESILGAASTPEEARRAVVDVICGEFWQADDNRALTLSYELYAYANRDTSMRPVMQRWMERSQRALAVHFDPFTVRLLDALIEGLTIHRSVELAQTTVEEVEQMVALATKA